MALAAAEPRTSAEERRRRAQQIMLYAAGDLEHCLLPQQRPLRRHFYATEGHPDAQVLPFLCCRGFGKSLVSLVLAYELCIAKPGSQVVAVADTKEHIAAIINRRNRGIIERQGPASLRFRFYKHDNLWVLSRKGQQDSFIVGYGAVDGNADSIRGDGAHLAWLEEARDVPQADYVIEEILIPLCERLGFGGRIICPTTSPRSPTHPIVKYIHEAQRCGVLFKRTLYDCPDTVPPDRVERLKRRSKGGTTPGFRREWLVELIVDEESAVVPEFAALEGELVGEQERPDHFDAYTWIDVGYHDATVAGFGYYNFLQGRIVVEDELVFRKTTSEVIARGVRRKEGELWGGADFLALEAKIMERPESPERDRDHAALCARWKPYMRVADINSALVRADLAKNGLPTVQPDKQVASSRTKQLEGAVNALRIACKSRHLLIHPRCTTTISDMRNAIWDKARKRFERGLHGHYDGVAMMVYAVRSVNRQRNPYPDLPIDVTRQKAVHRAPRLEPAQRSLQNAFARKRRR